MELATQRLVDQGVMGLMLLITCLALVYVFKLAERLINRLFDVVERNTKALADNAAAMERLREQLGIQDWHAERKAYERP